MRVAAQEKVLAKEDELQETWDSYHQVCQAVLLLSISEPLQSFRNANNPYSALVKKNHGRILLNMSSMMGNRLHQTTLVFLCNVHGKKTYTNRQER